MIRKKVILVIGLATTRPFPEKIEITSSSHYWMCEAQGGSKVVFLVLFVIYAAILLLFATFLAAKTRSAGIQYQRYRECKQMGFSVYNILLCAVIGFVVSVIPDTTFYTRYYFSVTVTLWATSFSMFIVFVPKLHDFFQHKITEELQNQMKKETTLDKKRKPFLSFLKSRAATHHLQDHHMEYGNELLSLDQILASSHPVLDDDDDEEEEEQEENDHQLRRRKASAVSAASTTHYKNGQGNLIEIHEGELPVRKAFRYFPFLSQWEMHHIMVFPWLNYFSHFSVSKKDKKKISMTQTRFSIRKMPKKVLSCLIPMPVSIRPNSRIMS
ncbi:hypothetical protein EDC96DRAFT_439588 [Choanephora cucurbitarum]|nr:hypothetical protein EDC96DRAFT_439588 [Choanephora cucurbitarum]